MFGRQVALLLRLHQIGLDEKFWKGGRRPMIAVYQVGHASVNSLAFSYNSKNALL